MNHKHQAPRTEPDTWSYLSHPPQSPCSLEVWMSPWGLPRKESVDPFCSWVPQAIWEALLPTTPSILPSQLGPRIKKQNDYSFRDTPIHPSWMLCLPWEALFLNHVFFFFFFFYSVAVKRRIEEWVFLFSFPEKVNLLSHVWLFVTPWTVAYQAPLSMGFFRQEYWSGLPFPSSGFIPDPGIEPRSLTL